MSGVLRIFLLLCEIGWFSYLYYNYNLNNPVSNDKKYSVSTIGKFEYEISSFIQKRCKYNYSSDKVHVAQCVDDKNKFIITVNPIV